MWKKKYNYKIIEDKPLKAENSNWIDDWFVFSYNMGMEKNLNHTVSVSFAYHITSLMSNGEYCNDPPQSYLKEADIQKEINKIVDFQNKKVDERKQKQEVFYKILLFYIKYIKRYEKKVVSMYAHLPEEVENHIGKSNFSKYVVEQMDKYMKDKTIKKEPFDGNRLKLSKDHTVHFLLTPSEYELFKDIDGDTTSNKILNLWYHEKERKRQKERRLEILNKYFPTK